MGKAGGVASVLAALPFFLKRAKMSAARYVTEAHRERREGDLLVLLRFAFSVMLGTACGVWLLTSEGRVAGSESRLSVGSPAL